MRILVAIADTDTAMEALVQVAQWAARLKTPYIRLLQTIPGCGSSPEVQSSRAPNPLPSTQEHRLHKASEAFDKAKIIFAQHGIAPHCVDSLLCLNVEDGELPGALTREARAGRFNRIILASKAFSKSGQYFAPGLTRPEPPPWTGGTGPATVYSLDVDETELRPPFLVKY